MNTMIEPGMVQAVGWTLVHSVWEGAAIAGVYAAVRPFLQHRGPQVRYLAACVALLLILLAPAVTLTGLWLAPGGKPVHREALATREHRAAQEASVMGSGMPSGEPGISSGMLGWVVAGWAVGVGVMGIRLTGGLLRVGRLGREGVHPVAGEWHDRLADMAMRLGVVQPVGLWESDHVRVPTLVGVLKPVILLPVSALTGLTPDQLDAVLAHELAHVRRHDLLVNLIQCGVEAVLFYHPAVWWISGQIRQEREQCCDLMAVSVWGTRVDYARTLLALEEWRSEAMPIGLAATGGSMLERVQQLLGKGPAASRRGRILRAALWFGLVAGLVGAGYWCMPVRGPSYVAVARLVVGNADVFDPYAAQVEMEAAGSHAVLGRVIGLLPEAWRVRRDRGAEALPDEVRALRARLTVRAGPGNLFEIRVRDANPERAAAIANLVAKVTTERTQGIRQGVKTEGERQLEAQLEQQEVRVTAYRSEWEKLREKLGNQGHVAAMVQEEEIRMLCRERAEAQMKRIKLETLVQVLGEPSEAGMTAVLLSERPDVVLSRLIENQAGLQQQISGLGAEFGNGHPRVVDLQSRLKTVDSQIRERQEGMLSALKSEIRAESAHFAQLELRLRENQEIQERRVGLARPSEEAKEKLDREVRLAETLRLRLMQERIDAGLQQSRVTAAKVEVVDPAVVPVRAMRWFW